jgi:hypothetical protein
MSQARSGPRSDAPFAAVPPQNFIISLFFDDIFSCLNIPADGRSSDQQRRACSSCLTIREFEQ